jgi:hypothetical protein
LPDGRFLAFYPDYFSADRNPYWQIHNIEIIDFGIQLNDDSLATHVYVVGDTLDPTNPQDWLNVITSRGVATLKQAETFHFINPAGGDINPANAEAFLSHYGARPHQPESGDSIIRSTFYEYFLAWQRFMLLWSQQFATSVQFTFQPEVMAGGIIKFPDHGVQMFVESVTHEWDYASGFTTSTTLTAPQLTLDSSRQQQQALPGFALARGSTNWVGLGGDQPLPHHAVGNDPQGGVGGNLGRPNSQGG